jgi:CheY-like chemotaxis protein
LAFIRRARGDPKLRKIPSVVITSRDSRYDRTTASAAGASDYIVKNEFDEPRLLGRIEQLIAR